MVEGKIDTEVENAKASSLVNNDDEPVPRSEDGKLIVT
jgi:hypothetical protein